MTVIDRISFRILLPFLLLFGVPLLHGQGAQNARGSSSITDSDKDHVKERNEWFYRGRVIHGKAAAELRRRAYQAKLQMRTQSAAARIAGSASTASVSTGSWVALGPAPLASDASGNHTQDYHQVAGRVTAVAIDPADPTGNTVYIGGAQGGVWKSWNAAYSVETNVGWTPLTDNQATLSIGSIAIQPGADPSTSVILAASGEANSSGDSYFGLGILRSIDAGNSWTLVSTANNGGLSFSGLGGTRMAFSTANGQQNTVVSAMAASSEGLIDGAVTARTVRGLYTSLNAGQSWTYNALLDPGGATDATSATSVAYNGAANSGAGLFFAAIRYHGFYSSPDGTHWTRLAAQPGGTALSTTNCPPQSTANNRGCRIYRGEITVVPGRNEMYVWYVFVDEFGIPQDGGIWKSRDGGASWTAISSSGITNCGDIAGCGVEQGTYNLELLAVANNAATDLYAGAVNIYKCAISSANATCTNVPFMNLTHAYGCVPVGAPAHVHPDQHALAALIPTTGSDSGNELLYFANDGGLNRALNGFSGLNSGACSGINDFDDLNQNLGSLTQFVSFAQHPTDADTVLGGTQDNGTAATGQATWTNPIWVNVLGGDGGYNAIDPLSTSNWYASNPDLPPGGLGIQLCTQGVNCNNSTFNFVVTSNTLGGDDGGFYFPYVLDASSAMVIGTCRVWRGSRTGGVFAALSPNFETLGSGSCNGEEVNQVRALATAGPIESSSGSSVIYATTSGLGPMEGPLYTPSGGRVWVTTDSSEGIPAWVDVTEHGPQGSINPNQFPISSVAADSSDPTGKTAYVTIMGFTGGTGHVWKTINAGASWTDFTANLPDSPANAIVVYPALSQVYVGTDVGVFASSTLSANWTELGPNPNTNQPGFLPNVAVTALGIFSSGGQQLLRASTYGRGIWQFNLVITPDFKMSVSNTPLTVFTGQTGTFTGTVTALNGYTNSVTLSCVAGTTPPPSVCSPSPLTLTPGSKTPFTVRVSDTAGDYNFKIQAVGSDSNHVTQNAPVLLRLVSFGITTPSPGSVTVPRGTASSPVTFNITAAGSFDQSVAVSCSTTITNAACNLTPGTTVNPSSNAPANMTASVTVPAETAPNAYSVRLQATTAGATSALATSFVLNVTAYPHFDVIVPASIASNAGSSPGRWPISIASVDGFNGTVTLRCTTSYGDGSCSTTPSSVSSFPASPTVTINGTSLTPGAYTILVTGTSGSVVQSKELTLNVGDYSISAPQKLSAVPAAQVSANVKLSSLYGYTGPINSQCDRSAFPAAICTLSPADSISLLSGGTGNLTVTITVPNDAVPGTYNITINSHDANGGPSHSATIALSISPDFVLTSSTPSQTITAGQTSGAYNLTIQPVGNSFDAPVSVACTTGLPAGAQCSFNPATPVTPGTSAVNLVMSISTVASRAALDSSPMHAVLLYETTLSLFGFVAVSGWTGTSLKGRKKAWWLILVFSLSIVLVSCSGVSSGTVGGTTGPPKNPVTYTVTVTGSSPGTPSGPGHSATVTLVVN